MKISSFFAGFAKRLPVLPALSLALCAAAMPAAADPAFAFGSISTLDDMTSLIRSKFPLGTSRADLRHAFVDMGKMFVYSDVDPWRSIFDFDPADRIVPYPGSCERADKIYDEQKRAQKR